MPNKQTIKTKEKSLIVDGGLLSNFPLWVFEDSNGKRERPILGVKLSESIERIKPRKINNALDMRSEEHTSELQSRGQLVCRLLLEKKDHIREQDVLLTQ